MSKTTQAAARRLGEALAALRDGGVCEPFDALHAAMTATPDGGTPERAAVLDALRD